MNKQEIFTKLATIVKGSDYSDLQVSLSKSLATKVLRNQISLEEATKSLQDILKLSAHPMMESIKSKPVHKNLERFYTKGLSNSDCMKMISSLITHSIIESSVNPDYKLEQITPLSEYLNSIISGKNIDRWELCEVLNRVGLGKEVVMSE